MDKLQNSSLNGQSLYEPMAYMALALLAGKTRLIELFPKSSPAGLAFIAGMTSASAIAYDAAVRKPKHDTFWTIVGKIAFSSIGFIVVTAFAKPLKERISLTPKASIRFISLCWFPMLFIASKTQKSLQLQAVHDELQTRHDQFKLNPRNWQRLDAEKQKKYALDFMNAGLGSLPNCKRLSKSSFPDPKSEADWRKLTPAQMSWCMAVDGEKIFNTTSEAFYITQKIKLGYNPPKFFANDLARFDAKQIDELHKAYCENPEFFHLLIDDTQEKLLKLFKGKSLLPAVNPKLTVRELTTMNFQRLDAWKCCIDKTDQWSAVPAESRSIFLQRYLPFGCQMVGAATFKDPINIDWIEDITFEEIKALNGYRLRNYHNLMREHKDVSIKIFTNAQLRAFNARFEDDYSLEIIKP